MPAPSPPAVAEPPAIARAPVASRPPVVAKAPAPEAPAIARVPPGSPAYEVLNLRSGVAWSSGSLEVGLVNALNRFYSLPLGGAYLGQGPSMTTNGIPWGVPVPGMGRSISVALNLYY